LTSLVWQFGTLRLLGFGLDPLAVLVPFLVFAIGVSHGVQQINFIVRELAHGKTTEEASRLSFTGLLIPGTLALVTALVSFVTLLLIPIPMIRELAHRIVGRRLQDSDQPRYASSRGLVL
jgi:hypothetical protein